MNSAPTWPRNSCPNVESTLILKGCLSSEAVEHLALLVESLPRILLQLPLEFQAQEVSSRRVVAFCWSSRHFGRHASAQFAVRPWVRNSTVPVGWTDLTHQTSTMHIIATSNLYNATNTPLKCSCCKGCFQLPLCFFCVLKCLQQLSHVSLEPASAAK